MGVLLEATSSSPHPALAAALRYAPATAAAEEVCPASVDPLQLLPAPDAGGQRHWLHYSGSLTTPPCSEQVEWFVMRRRAAVTQQQVRAMGGRGVCSWCLYLHPMYGCVYGLKSLWIAYVSSIVLQASIIGIPVLY